MNMKGLALVSAIAATVLGCAEPVRSVSPDTARNASPLPSCVVALAPVATRAGLVRPLSAADALRAVFPSLAGGRGLTQDSKTCNGNAVFTSPVFEGGSAKGGWPLQLDGEAVKFGGGANRIKVAWIRTHTWEDGSEGGVMGLIRTQDQSAEVYSVGAYRGTPARTQLALGRMGSELVVTALDEGCRGAEEGQPCESALHLYLPWRGQLRELARIAVEKRELRDTGEAGATGKITYRLQTGVDYAADQIKLTEQLKAVDASGRTLREATLRRALFVQDAKVTPSDTALWDQLVDSQGRESHPSPAKSADGAQSD